MTHGVYSNSTLQYPTQQSAELSMILLKVSPVYVQAPAEKGISGTAIDSLMGRVSTAVSTCHCIIRFCKQDTANVSRVATSVRCSCCHRLNLAPGRKSS
ncbi:Adenine nucleotide translocator 1 [Artemisia annua]|uniref:Adenine nucleotide translocator 1 n=1 Tax=Artemisia annua TaxID=35608 RepID=A0A2U1MQV5_ARTAN|nr:Adenine nucleotide translocator 1 [Artemisia annua]PWA63655.1 Adenine nucleotide translocator 1 [Artemisia annua]